MVDVLTDWTGLLFGVFVGAFVVVFGPLSGASTISPVSVRELTVVPPFLPAFREVLVEVRFAHLLAIALGCMAGALSGPRLAAWVAACGFVVAARSWPASGGPAVALLAWQRPDRDPDAPPKVWIP